VGPFCALAVYLTVQPIVVFVSGYRPHHSVVGIAWTAVTAVLMFGLAVGKIVSTSRPDAQQRPVRRKDGALPI
jgi:hypothetical protein